MSEASQNWPDFNQVIDDNLEAREDERVQEHKRAAEARDEPEEGADSDETRVERARKSHEGQQDTSEEVHENAARKGGTHAVRDKDMGETAHDTSHGLNSEPPAVPEETDPEDADLADAPPATDGRQPAEDKPEGGEYGKSVGGDDYPLAGPPEK